MQRYARQRSRENTLGNGGTRIERGRHRTKRIPVATPPRKGAREMSLVKRGKTWHTHFFVDGERFRQSLETSDWREAQAKEKELIAQASQGKLAPASQQFSRLSMNEALDRYLADRSARVAGRSHRSESDHAKPLRAFFGQTHLHRITAEAILSYIRARKAKGISNTTCLLYTSPSP